MPSSILTKTLITFSTTLLFGGATLVACNQTEVPLASQNTETTQTSNPDAIDDSDKKPGNNLGSIISSNKQSEQGQTNNNSQSKRAQANQELAAALGIDVSDLENSLTDSLVGKRKYQRPVSRKIATVLEEKNHKLKISQMQFYGAFDLDNDGGDNAIFEGEIALDGFGAHKFIVNNEDFPMMDNRKDIFVVTDTEAQSSTTFHVDQDKFNYTLKNGDDEVIISTSPDGSWVVNGETADTPEAVAKILVQTPVIQRTSIHSIALLLGSAKNFHADLVSEELPVKSVTQLKDEGDLIDDSNLVDFEPDAPLLANEATQLSLQPSQAPPVAIMRIASLFPRFLIPYQCDPNGAALTIGDPIPLLEALLNEMKAAQE